MCGIAGYIGRKHIDERRIRETLYLMKNRGPDYQDCASFHYRNLYISLLHSRLNIIDLNDRANQPFTLGPFTLIFNGEIYNYVELRERLENDGTQFITKSDTEVLLRSYMRYGEQCVNDFEGMWSFAIWDHTAQHLFLSRDRFAEKPLYYLEAEDGIYFGSEIKFIRKLYDGQITINQNQLLRYLVNGYKSLYKTKETFYHQIREVSYATNMDVDGNLNISFQRYWQPQFQHVDMSLEEAISGARGRLLDSIQLRLRADVPLAFCLSGGVDSSGIVSAARKEFDYDVVTYSIIDPDERYNELDNIQAVIKDLNCRHTFIHLRPEGHLTRLKEIIAYHDGPIATISYLIHSYISQSIAKDGYKVAVSGTGADEIFTGYYDHFNLHLNEVKDGSNFSRYLNEWETHIRGFIRNPLLQNPQLYFDNPNFREHIYFRQDEFVAMLRVRFLEEFFEHSFTSSLLRNRMLNEMFHEVTCVILHEDDLNSMYHSIENRSPYLDSQLFSFVYSIPSEYLIQHGYGKYILREALAGILNEDIRLDRRKRGFNASIASLIDFSNPAEIEYLLADNPVFELIDKEKISQLFHLKSIPNSISKFLFNFINIKLFYETCV